MYTFQDYFTLVFGLASIAVGCLGAHYDVKWLFDWLRSRKTIK